MRAILISIKPKWVAKILNGEKTIEIRKTMPKCDLPIDVYIYCTKRHRGYTNTIARLKNNKFINFDKPDEIMPVLYDIEQTGFYGKVVAKFTLKKCEEWHNYSWFEITKKGCVSDDELRNYSKGKASLYIWHIDNLEIFDKPKELSEFHLWEKDKIIRLIVNNTSKLAGECLWKPLTKAPQNFCYVEVE